MSHIKIKPVLYNMQATAVQISLCFPKVGLAGTLNQTLVAHKFGAYTVSRVSIKFGDSCKSCLVIDLEDKFSCDEAHFEPLETFLHMLKQIL